MIFHLAQVYNTIATVYQQINLSTFLLRQFIVVLLFLWIIPPCIFFSQNSADAKFLLDLVSMPKADILKGPATPIVVSRCPFRGLPEVLAITFTVNSSPDIELTYLMQRDVYGDDPLTEDMVELKEPAEFALIINNKGNGEAKNLRMLTEQPRITENEKGLLIDFQLLSSQVNGEPATLSFGKTIANNFGSIPAHSQANGQWWLESSLLGHFASYEVETTHVTSYGNQNLSLIDTVSIHEMVYGFTDATALSSKQRRGYWVNDIVDADDMPDVVCFTDASYSIVYQYGRYRLVRCHNFYDIIVTTGGEYKAAGQDGSERKKDILAHITLLLRQKYTIIRIFPNFSVFFD